MKLHPPTPIGSLGIGVPFVKDNRNYYRSFSAPFDQVIAYEVVNRVVQFKDPIYFDKNDLVQPLVL